MPEMTYIMDPGTRQVMDAEFSRILGVPPKASTTVGPSPIATGLWFDVHTYQDGDRLNLDLYVCKAGHPEIFKASVDLRPIAQAVKNYHELLHASTKVSGLVPGGSKEAVSANVRELMGAGYPQKQAVAIALRNARLAKIGCTAVNGGVGSCEPSVNGRKTPLPAPPHLMDTVNSLPKFMRPKYVLVREGKQPQAFRSPEHAHQWADDNRVSEYEVFKVGEGPGLRNITDEATLLSVMGLRSIGAEIEADILDDDLKGVIIGCACQRAGEERVAGEEPELLVGWNPFKAASKLVKDIGETKLVKAISKQVRSAAASPIVSKAVSAAAMGVPGGSLLVAQYNAVRMAANVHKARGNLLKAGVLQMQQAIRDNDPKNAVQAMVKALPPSLQHEAGPIVDKVYNAALNKVPGGDLLQLGQDTLTKITAESLPTSVKDIAKNAIQASKTLKAAAIKAGPGAAHLALPQTANLLPKVSPKAVGVYAAAQKGIAALEESKKLKAAIRQVSTAKAFVPQATGNLLLRKQALTNKAAQLMAMPVSTPQQVAAKNALHQEYQLEQRQIREQAAQVLQMKQTAAANQAVLSALDPSEIQQRLQLAEQMRTAIEQVLVAAQSTDPLVREGAQRAAAIFSMIARSRAGVQTMGDTAHVSGVAVGAKHSVHRTPATPKRFQLQYRFKGEQGPWKPQGGADASEFTSLKDANRMKHFARDFSNGLGTELDYRVVRVAGTDGSMSLPSEDISSCRLLVSGGIRSATLMVNGGWASNKLEGRVQLERVHLNRGGYDRHGQYWGVGKPLYVAHNADGVSHVRADDRTQAKQLFQAKFPSISFYR